MFQMCIVHFIWLYSYYWQNKFMIYTIWSVFIFVHINPWNTYRYLYVDQHSITIHMLLTHSLRASINCIHLLTGRGKDIYIYNDPAMLILHACTWSVLMRKNIINLQVILCINLYELLKSIVVARYGWNP